MYGVQLFTFMEKKSRKQIVEKLKFRTSKITISY